MEAAAHAFDNEPTPSLRLNSSGYLYWRQIGQAHAALFSLDVLEEIEIEAAGGLSALPRRGLAVGGVLLGSVCSSKDGTRLVQVERAAQFNAEHSSSFAFSESFSEKDDDAFGRYLERLSSSTTVGDKVVGYYRSHAHERLSLDEADTQLIHKYFPTGDSIFLLVKPVVHQPITGGFFIWEDRTAPLPACCLEFPFRRTDLISGGYEIVPGPGEPGSPNELFENQNKPNSQHGAAGVPLKPAEDIRRISERWQKHLGWAPPVFGALILAYLTLHQPARKPAEADFATSTAARAIDSQMQTRADEPAAFGLTVEPKGEGVRVSWDRHSPVIERASSGLLTVVAEEGGRQIPLTPEQLQNGSAMYYPATSELEFSLEVFALSGKSTRESVVLMSAPAAAQKHLTSESDAAASRKAPAEDDVKEGPKSANALKASIEQPYNPAALAATKSAQATVMAVDPLGPPKESLSAQRSARSPEATKATFHPTITSEVQHESTVRRVIRKVPGLRHFRSPQNSGADDFTPAKQVRVVEPDIPRELQSQVAGSVLDVRATVLKDGTLEVDRVLTENMPARLTNLVLYAVQEATFEPARVGNKSVASHIILHYRF